MGPLTSGARSELTLGARLGDYEILGVAGVGGMGVVYRARQLSLDRFVALKVIREDVAGVAEYRERFLREAYLAASVDHPHVVSVFDVGEYDERLVLAMQWIEGEDLCGLLEQSGQLAPDRAVRLVSQLAGALDAVHDVGLLHRDVKPANVLLRDLGGTEHAYLTDFGMARPSDPGAHLTQTGRVVGTTGYLSPEQIRGAEPGPRSDLYALGCLFFEALTGAPPFRGENEMAVQWAHANDPRPLTSMLVPALGERYDQLVSRALAISPEQRFGSGHEFAHALAVAQSGETIQPSAVPITPSHEPTVVGPSTPLPPAALQTPPPQPPMYQGYGYATPAPAPSQSSRGGNPLALILLAVVALTGIAVGALIAAGVFAQKGSTRTVITGDQARATPPQRAAGPRQVPRGASTSARSTTSTHSAPASLPGSPVTSQDSNGYNVGPGCSDDPQTSLPGCDDSPSAPGGDAVSSCSGGGALEVYSATTSCGLASAVVSNYSTDGQVTVTDGSGTTNTFTCQTGGQGTTGDTICVSGTGLNELYLRWLHQ